MKFRHVGVGRVGNAFRKFLAEDVGHTSSKGQ